MSEILSDYSILEESDYLDDKVFVDLDLHSEIIAEKVFYKTTFKKCLFQSVKFKKCTFESTIVDHSSFLNCQFIDCSFRGTSFNTCKALGIDWSLNPSSLGHNLTFTGCDLSYSTFNGLKLRDTQFKNCKMHECEFVKVDLKGITFQGSDLLKSKIHKTNLTDCDFRGCINLLLRLEDNSTKGMIIDLTSYIELAEMYGVTVET